MNLRKKLAEIERRLAEAEKKLEAARPTDRIGFQVDDPDESTAAWDDSNAVWPMVWVGDCAKTREGGGDV